MKIKADFVTNSSSSSFVVMGSSFLLTAIPKDYLITVAKTNNLKLSDEEILDDPYEIIDLFTRGSDLTYSFGDGYDGHDTVMAGICYTNMKGDETLNEFKTRVQLQILEKFGLPTQPGHIEECWMDN